MYVRGRECARATWPHPASPPAALPPSQDSTSPDHMILVSDDSPHRGEEEKKKKRIFFLIAESSSKVSRVRRDHRAECPPGPPSRVSVNLVPHTSLQLKALHGTDSDNDGHTLPLFFVSIIIDRDLVLDPVPQVFVQGPKPSHPETLQFTAAEFSD